MEGWLRRLLLLIPLLLAVTCAAFLLVRLAPGGPFDRERKAASPEAERVLLAKYHLDEPVWRQFVRYVADLFRGDLGPSLRYRSHSVNDILAQGLPVSLTLGGLAFLVAITLGVPLGLINALHKGGWIERTGSLVALLAICVPAFVLGPVMVSVCALRWRLLPVGLWGHPLNAVLPTLVLGLYFAGRIARLMQEGTLSVLAAGFVTSARAKGLSELHVVVKHVLPIAVLPVISYAGPMLADLLTGSFVVENLFQIPGLGVCMINASLNRDYPVVTAVVLFYSLLLMSLNLTVDLAYHALDPRVRRA